MVTTARHITTLLADVRALVTELAQAGHGDEDAAIRDRLERSVLRPLEQESALPPGAPAAAGPAEGVAEGVGVEPETCRCTPGSWSWRSGPPGCGSCPTRAQPCWRQPLRCRTWSPTTGRPCPGSPGCRRTFRPASRSPRTAPTW